MKDTIEIMDLTTRGGVVTYLNGNGNPLPNGAEPVWLIIQRDKGLSGFATNSRGEPFCLTFADFFDRREREAMVDLHRKFGARLMMVGEPGRVIIPTDEEWIGLNLLERDDEL